VGREAEEDLDGLRKCGEGEEAGREGERTKRAVSEEERRAAV
jgi:hypothetical protein